MPTDAATQPCPPPTKLETLISELEQQSKQQAVSDAKLKLADLNKINNEVVVTEKAYGTEYEKLKVSMTQIKATRKLWEEQIVQALSDEAKERINWTIKCEDERIQNLGKKWTESKGKLAGLQAAFEKAEASLGEAEGAYKKVKEFKADEKELEGLMAQSRQALGDMDLYKAYVLVVKEMQTIRLDPRSRVEFSKDLREAAERYFNALTDARKAKMEFEQATADSKNAKKEFEDAKAKRKDNILKLVAEAKSDLSSRAGSAGSTGDGQTGTSFMSSHS